MEMNVNEVYGASKYRQRVTQAPSSISIVTAEDIRRFGYRTMSDVLSGVRGMYTFNDRNYSFLGLRGFMRPGDFSTRVLVLVDGHRLNDAVYDGGWPGREALPDIELVERVEVIRGPSSSVYGSSAFLGVINVITKRGSDFSGPEASIEVASLDTYTVRGTASGSNPDGLDWVVSASGYSSAGESRLYFPAFDQRRSDSAWAKDDGIAHRLDDERATKLFGSVRYGSFNATAYHSDRVKQVPTASYGSIFNDPAERTTDIHSYLELSYKQAVSTHTDVQWRGFLDRSTYHGTYPFYDQAAGDLSDRVILRDIARGEWAGTEALLTLRPSERCTWVVGAEYRNNLHEDQRAYYETEPRSYDLDSARSSDVLGVFAQVEARLRTDLSLTAGVRHDRYGADIGSTSNPRIAAIYNPTSASALKALYGRAFRAPNPYERYYFEEQAHRADLRPETIDTYELVYELYFGADYRLSLSGYSYDIEGLITQASSPGPTPEAEPLYYYANLQDVRARGIELEWEGTFAKDTHLQGSLTAQRSRDLLNDRELSNSPHRMAKLRVTRALMSEQLFASAEVQYTSKASTLSGTRAPSFILTNLMLNARSLWNRFELHAGVYNLFDNKHWMPAAEEHAQSMLQQEGRTYMGRLTARF